MPYQVAVKPRTPKTLSIIRGKSPQKTIAKRSVDETPTYEEDKDQQNCQKTKSLQIEEIDCL